MLDIGLSREGFAIRSINYLLLFIVIVVIYMDKTDAQDYFAHSICILCHRQTILLFYLHVFLPYNDWQCTE
jgi:hypothetical protein